MRSPVSAVSLLLVALLAAPAAAAGGQPAQRIGHLQRRGDHVGRVQWRAGRRPLPRKRVAVHYAEALGLGRDRAARALSDPSDAKARRTLRQFQSFLHAIPIARIDAQPARCRCPRPTRRPMSG